MSHYDIEAYENFKFELVEMGVVIPEYLQHDIDEYILHGGEYLDGDLYYDELYGSINAAENTYELSYSITSELRSIFLI